MKKLIYFLILIVLLFSFESYSDETKKNEIELSQKQIEFLEEFKDYDGYTKVEWVSPLTLEITYDITKHYGLTKEEAKQFALLRAAAGYTYTLQDICVRIFISTKKDALAYECVGKDIPSET